MKKPGRFFPSSRLYLHRFCYGRMAQLRDTFSHFWLAIPQLVLHALWQDVWHSPQPPVTALFAISRVFRVMMCFIDVSSYIGFFARGTRKSPDTLHNITRAEALLSTLSGAFRRASRRSRTDFSSCSRELKHHQQRSRTDQNAADN